MIRDDRGPRRRAVWLAVVVAVLAGPAVAAACDTPVYRYAMYNWATVPYRVFYVHDRPADEKDADVNRSLVELGAATPPVNVALEDVDVSDPTRLERLPKPVQEAWQQRDKDAGAMHVVLSPWDATLLAGRLDAAALRAMADSPARTKMGELLDEGNAAVLILLAGENEEDNRQAEKVARAVIDQAAAIARAASGDAPDEAEAGEDDSDVANSDKADADVAVALLTVKRTDPAETWFVRNLMAIEPDLAKYAAEPMLFAAYGRGRTMMPYIGKGITLDNLGRCLTYLTGPCSCMVKAENPGADLLVRWDWQATADSLAAADESQPLADGQLAYHEFMPTETEGEVSPAARKGEPEARQVEAGQNPVQPPAGQAVEPPVNSAEGTPVYETLDAARDSFAVRQTWLLRHRAGRRRRRACRRRAVPRAAAVVVEGRRAWYTGLPRPSFLRDVPPRQREGPHAMSVNHSMLSRRDFLHAAGILAGGLVTGFPGIASADSLAGETSTLSEHLLVYHGPINVGIVRDGRAGPADRLRRRQRRPDAAERWASRPSIEILFTHHHRDQACGAAHAGRRRREDRSCPTPSGTISTRWPTTGTIPRAAGTSTTASAPPHARRAGAGRRDGQPGDTIALGPGHDPRARHARPHRRLGELPGRGRRPPGGVLRRRDLRRRPGLGALQPSEGRRRRRDYHGFLGARPQLVESLGRIKDAQARRARPVARPRHDATRPRRSTRSSTGSTRATTSTWPSRRCGTTSPRCSPSTPAARTTCRSARASRRRTACGTSARPGCSSPRTRRPSSWTAAARRSSRSSRS